MEDLQTYLINLFKNFESGELDNFPDPGDPPDIGTPLTQDDIDFVKRLKKEVETRFTPP